MEFNKGQKIGILTMCISFALMFKCIILGTMVIDAIFWIFSLGLILTIASSWLYSRFVGDK